MATAPVYSLDPTGVSPNNLVQGEVHQLAENLIIRPLATRHGAFYAESVVVRDYATDEVLTRDVDYFVANFHELPSVQFDKDVCSIVVIVKSIGLSSQVAVDYQAVGGEIYSQTSQAVVDVLEKVNLSFSSPNWPYPLVRPSEITPMQRLFDKSSGTYGFEYAVLAIDRLARAVQHGDENAHDAIYTYIGTVFDGVDQEILELARQRILDEVVLHRNASDPHPQYVKKGVQVEIERVRTPVNITPSADAIDVTADVEFLASSYGALYRIAQKAMQIQISTVVEFTLLHTNQTISGAVNTFKPSSMLANNTVYYWRVRYQSQEDIWSKWSTPTKFTTLAANVLAPTITAPANNAAGVGPIPTLQASAFTVVGTTDTHHSSDWEIWTGPEGTGTLVHSSAANMVDLTSLAVPSNKLQVSTRYYPRVRYRGSNLGYSGWSSIVSFQTADEFVPTVIGQTFGGGYYAGMWNDGVKNWYVIVAPKETGETSNTLSNSEADVGATSRTDSAGNTTKQAAGNGAAAWASSLVIGLYDDWVLPAVDVLRFINTNLAPGGAATPALFKTGGAQAFDAANYWSSTQYNWVDSGSTGDTPIYGTVTQTVYYPDSTLTYPGSMFEDFLGWISVVGSPDWRGIPGSYWTSFDLTFYYIREIWGDSDGDGVYAMEPLINPDTGQADWQVYGRCYGQRTQSSTQVIGYEPGSSWYYEYFYGYRVNMATNGANENNTQKTSVNKARAVRLQEAV